jgi:iron complex outermembrane recepter protein
VETVFKSFTLNATKSGLEVLLQTDQGTMVQPTTRTEGNTLVAEIPNAILALAEGAEFIADQPVAGVDAVNVIQADAQTVLVVVVGTEAVPTASVMLRPMPVAKEPAASDEEEGEITVTGQSEDGYVVPNSSVGTRTNTPLQDVLQSIQVIPRQVIEDQNVNTLDEVLRNVNGGGSRGFDRGIFTDGATRANNNFRSVPNLGNVEQVEVLDGPASVLYGRGGPGGVVNLTTKLPLRDPFYEIAGTIGNYDDYRGNIDLTGPLDERKLALYRLNINYENIGSFIDFVNTKKFTIFPTLSFQVSENTTLILEGSYERQSRKEAVGLPLIGTLDDNPLGEVSRSRFLGEPESKSESTTINIGYRLEHKFSEDWALRNRFRANFVEDANRGVRADSLEEDNRTVIGGSFDSRSDDQLFTLQTEVLGKVQTGIVQHELLLGLELQRSISKFRGEFPEETRAIDLFDPDYLNGSEFDAFFGDFEPTFDDIETLQTIGVYAQNLLSIGKQVKILLGGRFDQVFQNLEDDITGSSDYSEPSAFSPRVGIVYKPIEPVSLYASWSRSFEPQLGRDRERNPFIPIEGEQFEVGVKTEFLNRRLALNLSAYQITRQNDFLPDPVDSDFDIQTGEQRSRGIEFDVTGQPLPGLRLIAGYAYTDSIITKGTPDIEGNQRENVPKHQANVWAVYEIQSGALEGFGLGAGLFFVGDRQGDSENTFTLPNYLLTNAVIYYRQDRWRVQLNIDNLFDVEYFPSRSDIGVTVGEPLKIRGTVSVRF